MIPKVKAFCTSRSCKLFFETCSYLGIEPYYLSKVQFSNGEVSIVFPEAIKGLPVIFFVQPTKYVNNDLMELLFTVHAAKCSGASRIIVVCPCSPYARQNQIVNGLPATISFIWQIMAHVGVNDWITFDLHEPVSPCKHLVLHNLSATSLLLESFKKHYLTNEPWVCVAADEGAIERAHLIAKSLNISLGFCKKIRKTDRVDVTEFVGNVAQKSVFLMDDMIDSGATLQAAIACLKQQGVRKIVCAVTHGIVKEEILLKLAATSIDGFIETNTLPVFETHTDSFLRVVSVAPLLAKKLKELIA